MIDILDASVAKPKVANQRYDYAKESRNPLASLAFVLPLLIWYQASIMLREGSVRSAIDGAVEPFFAFLGSASLIVVPFVLFAALLFYHHHQNAQPSFRLRTLGWMFLESVLLAVILFLACDALMLYADNQRPRPLSGITSIFSDARQYNQLISSLGAGIHEELLFRLLIFAPVFYWIKEAIKDKALALTATTIAVSFAFALAHCDAVNPAGFPFQFSTFAFRFFASALLCILFHYRGFAIAVGVHAGFDILATS